METSVEERARVHAVRGAGVDVRFEHPPLPSLSTALLVRRSQHLALALEADERSLRQTAITDEIVELAAGLQALHRH
jgi:hypothetical protein